MKTSLTHIVLASWIFLNTEFVHAGTIDLIHGQHSGSSGYVQVQAQVRDVVTLSIEDSPQGEGNLVSQSGINFGDVNNLGTTEVPGVKGTKKGNAGHYESEFSFAVDRSGPGDVTLSCRRSSPGNFNARDGIEIDDSHGTLRPLSALDSGGVHILQNASPGSYDRTMALNIYPSDKGTLRSVLQFTLSAL